MSAEPCRTDDEAIGQDRLQHNSQGHRGRDREPVLAFRGPPPRRGYVPLDRLGRRQFRLDHPLDQVELLVERAAQAGDR